MFYVFVLWPKLIVFLHKNYLIYVFSVKMKIVTGQIAGKPLVMLSMILALL